MKLELSIFSQDLCLLKAFFLPQNTVLENLNSHLGKSGNNAYEKVWEL